MLRKKPIVWLVPAVLSCLLLALWCLPAVWYTSDRTSERVWFTERTAIDGWTFEAVPIGQGAERTLVADRTVNGEFRNAAGDAVRVFSAKRFKENPNEIGLFVHTPDRCWVEGGWKLEPVNPDVVGVNIHGVPLQMERRIFQFGAEKELVYFCGLVDGRTLPYRLDHNLSVGVRTALKKNQATSGALGRASDTHFWERLWTSFTSRRALSGPKQFIRISTPLRSEDASTADERLQRFVSHWLGKSSYEQELVSFSGKNNERSPRN
jgi:hypothetical protein